MKLKGDNIAITLKNLKDIFALSINQRVSISVYGSGATFIGRYESSTAWEVKNMPDNVWDMHVEMILFTSDNWLCVHVHA